MSAFDKSIFEAAFKAMYALKNAMERKQEVKPYIVKNYAKQGIGNRASHNLVITEAVYESNGVAAKVITKTLKWQPSRENLNKLREFDGVEVASGSSGSERFWEHVAKGELTNVPQLLTATIGHFIDQLRTGSNDSAESMVKAKHLEAILKTVKIKSLTVKRFVPEGEGYVNQDHPFTDDLDSIRALLKSFKPYFATIDAIPNKAGGRKGKAFADVTQADEGEAGGEFAVIEL